ncbi:hypothetical protein EZS27_039547, partial [termite gut metagenome]
MITSFPLGSYRGRIGNMVAYMRCGRQVFRSINDRPRNPRTAAQMRQRSRISNVVSAYNILAPFVRESYETRLPGLTAYNMFVKNNLKTAEVFLDKREAMLRACVVSAFNVSLGTLAPVETAAAGSRLITSLCLPADFEISGTTTLGEVSVGLLACNASLRCGDKLSILYMRQVRPDRAVESYLPCAELKRYEFELDTHSRIPFYTLADE